ncbi:hypothetical protein M501DRAFT_901406, partial [Patellaria atrata CBS 101060]
MPKLRKSGGVNTGADSHSPYLSDPETSQSFTPKPPTGSAPRPPMAPKVPTSTPPRPPPTVPGGASHPIISNLKNNLRPSSIAS